MKRFYFLLFLSCSLLISASFAQDLIPYKKGKLWGYCDKKGTIVIDPVYQEAGFFHNGAARVRKNSKYGLIDVKGNTIVPFEYNVYDLGDPYNNRCYFKTDSLFGYYDCKGKIVIPPSYQSCYSFFKPVTAVKKDGKYGLIDTTGKVLLPFQYEYLSTMGPMGYLTFSENKKMGLIDSKGNIIVPPLYKESGMHTKGRLPWLKQNFILLHHKEYAKTYGILFNNGEKLLYYVPNYMVSPEHFFEKKYLEVRVVEDLKTMKSKPAVVDEDGNLVVKLDNYDIIKQAQEEVIIVGNQSKSGLFLYGLVDINGKELLKPKYDEINMFRDGLSLVKHKGKYAILNIKGEIVVPFKDPGNKEISTFKYGLICYYEGNNVGYMDYNSNIIIPASETVVSFMAHGFLRQKKNNRYQLLNTKGQPVGEWYDKIEDREDGFYIEKDGKSGKLDKNGNLLFPLKYDFVSQLDSMYRKISVNNKVGVADSTGKEIFPPVFSAIRYIRQTGNFWVLEGSKWKMIDKNMKKLHEGEYSTIEYCKDGYYSVYKNRWGLVDPNGKLVIPLVCENQVEDINQPGMFGKVKIHGGYIGEDFTLYFSPE